MNSRNSVNETNLVNFSAEVSTLKDSKDGLLSFPFDHIYACQSQSAERRQPLQLEKEVEISTYCVTVEDKNSPNSTPEISKLTEQLSVAVSQNKKLKDLLIYHLDLIQQQNELITKRDKLYYALKQENDTLKTKMVEAVRQRAFNPSKRPPNLLMPTATVTSECLSNEPVNLESFSELLKPGFHGNSANCNKNLPLTQEIFGIVRLDPKTIAESSSATSAVKKPPPQQNKKKNSAKGKMIETKTKTKRAVKKDAKPGPTDAQCTVTSFSGTPTAQTTKRRASGTSSLSRVYNKPKIDATETSTSKVKTDDVQIKETKYTLNKKLKTINTYGKSKTTVPKKTTQFTGSLADRLRLIDTTPTGEDPYQLGEADMREQSPIPKLMLQKTNQGRMKIRSESTRRIFDLEDSTRKVNRFMSAYDDAAAKDGKTIMVTEPDMDIVKTETDINWSAYDKSLNDLNLQNDLNLRNDVNFQNALNFQNDLNLHNVLNLQNDLLLQNDLCLENTTANENDSNSLCDFSFGEGSNNLDSILPSLDVNVFQDLFTSDAVLNLDTLNSLEFSTEKEEPEKTKKRNNRTTSLVNPGEEAGVEKKRGNEGRRGRKRALSATGSGKQTQKKAVKPKTAKGKAAALEKQSPMPGMMTNKPYQTLVGDPDVSWYLGLDKEVKIDDVDSPAQDHASTVEVPRWREKSYTSCYSMEGTENLDDKVFEKRHQKLEAEERRQLRWHMRLLREQHHVDHLRKRQKNSNCNTVTAPKMYSVWQRPHQDAQSIEITKTLPVNAFGEPLPDMPKSDFKLPWVKTPKAQKKSKRSKTVL